MILPFKAQKIQPDEPKIHHTHYIDPKWTALGAVDSVAINSTQNSQNP